MFTKRLFDLALVIPGLMVLSPLFIIISLWIKVDSSGPVFFRQKRVGQYGKEFNIFKFRTMVVDAESLGDKVTVGSDSRITKSGVFLRKYKVDELPQLINVLKGEMSLVGPRPEVPEYVAYWDAGDKEEVLSVPPGITDFASIEFKDENDMLVNSKNPVDKYIKEIVPLKLEYNKRYVRERSVWLDISLIFKTLLEVFIR